MPVAERDCISTDTSGSYTIDNVSITAMTVGAWLDGQGTGSFTHSNIRRWCPTAVSTWTASPAEPALAPSR